MIDGTGNVLSHRQCLMEQVMIDRAGVLTERPVAIGNLQALRWDTEGIIGFADFGGTPRASSDLRFRSTLGGDKY